MGADIRRPLHVAFVSEHGLLEAGIDQGGLTKEFLEEVLYASFDLERGLMVQAEGGLAYPHPAAATLPGALPQLRLLGLLLGKALFEGILLDVPLAYFFITHLQVGPFTPLSPATLPHAANADFSMYLRFYIRLHRARGPALLYTRSCLGLGFIRFRIY